MNFLQRWFDLGLRKPVTVTTLATMPPDQCRQFIRARDRQIMFIEGEIAQLAEARIPDYHFLDYRVSRFWACDQSPIGMCVWELDEGRFHTDCRCRYCGLPVERK